MGTTFGRIGMLASMGGSSGGPIARISLAIIHAFYAQLRKSYTI